jgi:hypothetical protein
MNCKGNQEKVKRRNKSFDNLYIYYIFNILNMSKKVVLYLCFPWECACAVPSLGPHALPWFLSRLFLCLIFY